MRKKGKERKGEEDKMRVGGGRRKTREKKERSKGLYQYNRVEMEV